MVKKVHLYMFLFLAAFHLGPLFTSLPLPPVNLQ